MNNKLLCGSFIFKEPIVRPEEWTLVWVALQQQGFHWLIFTDSFPSNELPWVASNDIPGHLCSKDPDKQMVQPDGLREVKGEHFLGYHW